MERLKALKEFVENDLWSSEHVTQYGRLDQVITQSMLTAENSCSKHYTKWYDWSPHLIQAVEAVRYWRLLLKCSKGLPIQYSTILCARTGACLPDSPDPVDQPIIIMSPHQALVYMRSLQKSHTELKENYLWGLAKAIILQKRPHLQKKECLEALFHLTTQVERLLKREKKQRMYRTSGNVLTDLAPGVKGLTWIDIPAASTLEPFPIGPDPKIWTGPWGSVTDPSTIVKHICVANVHQYNQAEHTPFGSGELAQSIGSLADTPIASSLLEGTIPTLQTSLLPETAKILAILSTPLSLASQEILAAITP